ncbi:hypothetical protein Tco_0045288 [Tanacetum coccineum]
MEVKPLDHTKLEDLGLNTCSHDLFPSSREFPSVDEPEPQPLPNPPFLDVNLRGKRGTNPPINPYSLVRGDGVAGMKRRRHDLSGDGVRNLVTASGRGRLKEDLESSTWQVRGTVHPRWQYEVAGNVRWQYEVAAAGQSEHDTCPKRVIRGCQACVSPRLSCGDPRQ